jgi:hypothetical protein
MFMTDDEFDLRLRQAIKPLVTEIIPLSVVQRADRSTWRRPAFGAALPAALAFVIVVALAGGVALLRVSAPSGPGPSSSLLIGAAASHSPLGSGASSPALGAGSGGATVVTPDGEAHVRTSADGAHLELVLDKPDGTSSVLVSIPERTFNPKGSYVSVHVVDCAPSTGLKQQYYIVGQTTTRGTVTLHGIAGTATAIVGGHYLIAIVASSIPSGRWTFDLGTESTAFGFGGTIINLPTYGQKSAAGCYFGL